MRSAPNRASANCAREARRLGLALARFGEIHERVDDPRTAKYMKTDQGRLVSNQLARFPASLTAGTIPNT